MAWSLSEPTARRAARTEARTGSEELCLRRGNPEGSGAGDRESPHAADPVDRVGFFAGPDFDLGLDAPGEEASSALEIDPHDLTLDTLIAEGLTADTYSGDLEGRRVAVKVYRRAKLFNIKQQVSFCREVDTLRALKHPNLVRLIGAVMLASPFRLVTEYCEGGNLNDLLHERMEVNISWRQRRKMALDISQAMAYLHSQEPQVIHRDLTSFNCFLDAEVGSAEADPVVKVGNFGFARMRASDAERACMTSDVGTLFWMAPEILRHEYYDFRVDVYSFAIVLYELSLRRTPFSDLDACSFQMTVAVGGRPDVRDIPAACPAALVRLMQSCWAHDPAARPGFADIAAALVQK